MRCWERSAEWRNLAISAGCLGCGGAACDCDFCVWERMTASVSPVPACGTGGGHDGCYWWDGRWWQWMPTLAGDASSEEGLWRQVSDDNSAANSDERWANHVSVPGSPSSPRTPPGLEPARRSADAPAEPISTGSGLYQHDHPHRCVRHRRADEPARMDRLRIGSSEGRWCPEPCDQEGCPYLCAEHPNLRLVEAVRVRGR